MVGAEGTDAAAVEDVVLDSSVVAVDSGSPVLLDVVKEEVLPLS